jgi:hypothetical protein
MFGPRIASSVLRDRSRGIQASPEFLIWLAAQRKVDRRPASLLWSGAGGFAAVDPYFTPAFLACTESFGVAQGNSVEGLMDGRDILLRRCLAETGSVKSAG